MTFLPLASFTIFIAYPKEETMPQHPLDCKKTFKRGPEFFRSHQVEAVTSISLNCQL